VLAFASVPLALSLVLWPVKLALYGADVFHEGGADAGAGGVIFVVLGLGFLLWTVGLLVLGVRAVHGWSWARAAAAVATAAAMPVLVWLALRSL
jgi:hypothetical protein